MVFCQNYILQNSELHSFTSIIHMMICSTNLATKNLMVESK